MLNTTYLADFNITAESISELSGIGFGEYIEIVKPLILFIVGITIYGIFVFKFYRFLAKRDIVSLNMISVMKDGSGKFFTIILNLLESIILTPILVFFWFAVLAGLFMLLAKNSSPNTVLLVAASLISAVRMTAYYNENLSQDLAKMIPFALLGVFLVDVSYFSIDATIAIFRELPSLWKIMFYYLAFIMALEIILRVVKTFTDPFAPEKKD